MIKYYKSSIAWPVKFSFLGNVLVCPIKFKDLVANFPAIKKSKYHH